MTRRHIKKAFSHRSVSETSTISMYEEWWWKYASLWLDISFSDIKGQSGVINTCQSYKGVEALTN